MPEIIDWWIQEGLAKGLEQGMERGSRQARQEDAGRMLACGCSWELITDVTGLKPEDL